MDMPAPVRIFRSLAAAGMAKRPSARMRRNMLPFDPRLLCCAVPAGVLSPDVKAKGIKMKTGLFAAAAIALALPAYAADTTPHEWNTILLEKVVDRTPDQTWARIGGYCTIQTWLKLQSCVLTVGNQIGVGTNRRLNGKTDEMMIAVTPYSYTYTQLPTDVQPASPIFYHGT